MEVVYKDNDDDYHDDNSSWCPVLLAQEYLLDFSPENELVNK